MLYPFTAPSSSIIPAPASSFELYPIKSVVDGASSKQVTSMPASLDLVMNLPAHVCHWSTARTQRQEKLKQTFHDMLIRAGTFRVFAIFTDTSLRSTEAALRLQGMVCCSEHERKDAIFQFHCLWNYAFRHTLTKWNVLYPHKYWGNL